MLAGLNRREPYEGHYIQPDEIDKAWGEAIRAVRKEEAGVDTRSATQRIADIRKKKEFRRE